MPCHGSKKSLVRITWKKVFSCEKCKYKAGNEKRLKHPMINFSLVVMNVNNKKDLKQTKESQVHNSW